MNAKKRIIGLHLRVREVLPDVMDLARTLELAAYQSFISIRGFGGRLSVNQDDIQYFIANKDKFDAIFLHGSYKINAASCTLSYHYLLEYEIKLAKSLGISSLILHPGSANGCTSKSEAIDSLARTLNTLQKKHTSFTFILENVAHGNMNVGSDIEDFAELISKLKYAERIQFCIDTAHAFCYGYDIRDVQKREAFIQFLEAKLGIEKIALLHINDTQEQLGSRHDKHAVIGKGVIGLEALRAFAMHPRLKHIPFIVEPPELSIEQYKDIFNLVKSWY